MDSSFLFTFLKFFTVGGVGFGLDMLTTYIFKDKLNWPKFRANTIGFIIGIIFRFFANKYWSFENTDPNWLLQMFQFGSIALVGLAMVNGIIWLLHDKLQLMKFYPAKVVSMIIFMLWNFTANYLWTFA